VPTSVTHYRITEIGGDGIGPDVVAEAVCALGAQHEDAKAAAAGHRIEATLAKALQEPGARTRDPGGTATTRAAGEADMRAL
jgi:isocitrate/isopropylmalate dehydrogenase